MVPTITCVHTAPAGQFALLPQCFVQYPPGQLPPPHAGSMQISPAAHVPCAAAPLDCRQLVSCGRAQAAPTAPLLGTSASGGIASEGPAASSPQPTTSTIAANVM